MINRLGLGRGVILTESRECQTEEEYVHKDVHDELERLYEDSEQRIIILERETEKLVKTIDNRDRIIETDVKHKKRMKKENKVLTKQMQEL